MLVAQRLATFLKLLRSIALSVLLLILLTWNFGTLNTSAREVLAMVPRIQQFEASGVKLVLKDEVKLRAALVAALDGALPDDGKREAINAVQKLTGPQVDRLFTRSGGCFAENSPEKALACKRRLVVQLY